MYQLTGVTKDYQKGRRTVRALDGVDLVIEDGDWLAIQGPTGHGKSTLAGRAQRTGVMENGRLTIEARPIRPPSDAPLR